MTCAYFRSAKLLWTVDDVKKRELDALVDRAQVALTCLLDLFVNVATPFFSYSRQIFNDILAIVKRCKEVEKILNSSFFESDEISELIEDIKDEMRKEKTTKLARYVADIYKYRTGVIKECPVNCEEGSVIESSSLDRICAAADNRDGGIREICGDANTEEDAANGTENGTGKETCKQLLKDLRSELDDPLLEIIFDNTIAAFLQSNEAEQLAVNGNVKDGAVAGEIDGSAVNGEVDGTEEAAGAVGNTKLCHPDVFQKLVKALCDNPDRKLNAKLQELSKKVKAVCNEIDNTTADNKCSQESGDCDMVNVSDGIKTGDDGISATKSKDDPEVENKENLPEQLESQTNSKEPKQVEAVTTVNEDNYVMAASHRTVCIKLVKAINIQIMHIKQEVQRKWLAYKMGCDEDISLLELLGKTEGKVKELVENGNGSFELITEAGSTAETNDSLSSSKEDNITELKSMECLRNSEGEIESKKVEDVPDDVVDKMEAEETEMAESGPEHLEEALSRPNAGEVVVLKVY